MDKQEFETLVTRLEQSAARRPGLYTLAVLGIAALGFFILGVAFGFAFLPVAVLVVVGVLIATKGAWALLVLAKLGKLVILLAIPAWTMIRSSLALLFSRFPAPQGREVTPAEAPRLFERLDELRRRLKGPAIHKVLLVDELNAAIVQHPRFGLLGWEQNILILGLPLLQCMSEQEAIAVVAHEYGHLSGHHGRLGGFIYRFRAAWARLQELSEKWTDWGSRLIARMFRWYAPYFNAYTFVLARQNEYAADQTAVEVAGQQNAANALIRVNITAQFADETFWPAIERRIVLDPEPPGNRSAFWEESLHTSLDPKLRARLLDVARQRETNHLNTHPALRDRLSAMGAGTDDEAARRLEAPAINASSAWLGSSMDPIAAELDGNWRQRIAERWRTRHAYLRQRQQRLAELESRETPTVDERWERLEALRELQPDLDRIPPLNELLDLFPDHLAARFQRGAVLLQRGDESGIADLELVMAQDKDAILSGCETAWRFYQSSEPEKAKAYLERWQRHSEQQARVKAERSSLGADAELAPANLTPEAQAAVTQILREHGQHVRDAYVLRRILKSDSSVVQYVLAVETGRLMIGDKGPQVVKELAKQAFPGNFFIVHLGSSPFTKFRETIERLGIQPLSFR